MRELDSLIDQYLDELYEQQRQAGTIPWNDTHDLYDDDIARWEWESPQYPQGKT